MLPLPWLLSLSLSASDRFRNETNRGETEYDKKKIIKRTRQLLIRALPTLTQDD